MAASNSATPDQQLQFMLSPSNSSLIDHAQKQESQKPDSVRAVEMAVELGIEKLRVAEAMNARDTVVQRLSDAYVSIRQKVSIIDRLQEELGSPGHDDGTQRDNIRLNNEEIYRLNAVVTSLREEIRCLKDTATNTHATKSPGDPPPRYEEGKMESFKNDIDHASPIPDTHAHTLSPLLRTDSMPSRAPFRVLRGSSTDSISPETRDSPKFITDDPNELDYRITQSPGQSKLQSPEYLVQARHAILAALPVPPDIPDDALKPIIIPPPWTLHEFLANCSGSVRTSLSNYRVLPQPTTAWCPDREEHGYLLAPVFKCSTNPRIATAHRWSAVDVVARMNKPTECFYNKDGKWYYAGVYKAFRLEDLTTKEWEALSNETTQALIKETLSSRKNTSPQNIYETAQLYAAGALKVACVGLQCVGFNGDMYRGVLELAAKGVGANNAVGSGVISGPGKWKGVSSSEGLGLGLGAAGTVWNSTSTGSMGDIVSGVGGLSMGPGIIGRIADGIENNAPGSG